MTPQVQKLLPRAERRASILAGATRAFAWGGFTGTSMQDIASECGVTPPIVYRHFESKEGLYRAVLQAVADELAGSLSDAGSPFGMDFAGFLAAARRDPQGFELLWRHAAREPQFSSYAEDLRQQAVEAVAGALGRDVPARQRMWAAHAVVGFAVEGALNWLRFGDAEADDRIVEATTEALRAGIRAWARSTPPRS
ncbi:MAG: TetR/AcrR family transcriptional regulator [Myxococcota bacterium]|nr:TetR/AcrR family transcriptional regulator [Myxococcota bacterium]